MGQTRLISIATFHIKNDREVDFDQVIGTFDESAIIHGRRLAFK